MPVPLWFCLAVDERVEHGEKRALNLVLIIGIKGVYLDNRAVTEGDGEILIVDAVNIRADGNGCTA